MRVTLLRRLERKSEELETEEEGGGPCVLGADGWVGNVERGGEVI